MQEKWVIANWKMYLGLIASIKLTKIISSRYNEPGWIARYWNREQKIHVVVCPSFTAILEVAKLLEKTSIAIGAQDMFFEAKGAFTGEVSPLMLTEVGCDYVIIGHSERRHIIGETDEIIHRKVEAALKYHLVPVLCVGETQGERESGRRDDVIQRQLARALDGISLGDGMLLLIAYEPVFAIGSGRAVHPQEAHATHRFILECLSSLFPSRRVSDHFRVIYGGSVDSTNVASFSRFDTISGVLVGGASLRSKEFLAICESIKKS